MQYALLIYGDEDSPDARSEDERQEWYAEYATLSADLRREGKFLGGEELQPVSTATAVRVRNGDTLVSDGPFAETKETLGAYCLIEADSLDEAIEWASRIPSARSGTVEIRPVVDNSEHRE